MRVLVLALIVAHMLPMPTAQAQLGRIVKEGIEIVGKKAVGRGASEASQEASEQLLKKAASTTARKIGQEVVETIGERAAATVVRQSDVAVKAIAAHGPAIAAPILKSFGDEGAEAIAKLSSSNARRMAMLAEELGAGGRGADWMRVLADKGDIAAEWVWKNQGAIAIGTTAAAFLASPDAFLKAGEVVATTSIETAGKHVAEPLIKESVRTVIPAVAKQVSAAVAAPAVAMAKSVENHPWTLMVILLTFGGGGIILYLLYFHPWLRWLVKR